MRIIYFLDKNDLLKLFDNRHHIKSSIFKDSFKKNKLYKQILDETNLYDSVFPDLTFSDRLFILRYNIPIKYCKLCNSPYINIDSKLIKTCKCKFKKTVNTSKKINLFNDYKFKNFKSVTEQEIINLIYYINKNRNYNLDKLIKDNKDIICNIIKLTKDIIEFKNINDLKLIQRIYHIFYNLNYIPKCNTCLKQLKFKDFDTRIFTMYMQ